MSRNQGAPRKLGRPLKGADKLSHQHGFATTEQMAAELERLWQAYCDSEPWRTGITKSEWLRRIVLWALDSARRPTDRELDDVETS